MNSEAIVLRLKEILEYYSLTSSTFADSIDVRRSSISHLMSGRNKPSLDFVLKVTDKYPEVDLYWFLNGEGEFPKQEKKAIIPEEEIIPPPPVQDLFSQPEIKIQEQPKKIETIDNPIDNENEEIEKKSDFISNTKISSSVKKMVKVILLYDDGSFEEFNK